MLPLNMVDNSISPFQTPFGPVFSLLGSPDRPSHPAVRPLPTSSDGAFTNFHPLDTPPASGSAHFQAETGGKG